MGRFARASEEKLLFVLSRDLCTLLAAIILFVIIGTIFIEAVPSLTGISSLPPKVLRQGLGQGIANAVAGSIVLSVCSTAFATPFAFGYSRLPPAVCKRIGSHPGNPFFIEGLSRHSFSRPRRVWAVGFCILHESLYRWLSLISGSVALAILILPVIERSLEQAIQSVPRDIEEGSYALGADKWQTISGVTIPYALSGLITGMILGFGRAAEESAVVILTAGYTQFMPEVAIKAKESMFLGVKIYPFQDLIASLPYAVYHAYENSNVIPVSNGFAVAFILICFVLSVNVSAKFFISRRMTISSQGRSGMTHLPPVITNLPVTKMFISPKQDCNESSGSTTKTEITDMTSSTQKPETDPAGSLSLRERIAAIFSGTNKKTEPVTSPEGASSQNKSPSLKIPVRTLLRALLPFTIPAAPPPPHRVPFGRSLPSTMPSARLSLSLAGLFGTGLSLIITVVGLVFGLLLAKKAGVFKGKSRRIGYIGVFTGICLLCIAGVICSSAASGIFSTGERAGDKR